MKKLTAALLIVSLCGLFSCLSIRPMPKYRFSDDYYKGKTAGQKAKPYYVRVTQDTIFAYPTHKKHIDDTSSSYKLLFPEAKKPDLFARYRFNKYTFDLDVLTVLTKYRPSQQTVPGQLVTDFCGVVYAGFRNDLYKLSYFKTPLQLTKRTVTHYGYSMGLFSGIGAVRIDELVTQNYFTGEYQGVVNSSGAAFILGVNNVSLGLNIGVDFLLNRHRNVWVYQGKPWAGLSVGLNLN